MNQTPPKLIYIVVLSLAFLSFLGLLSLCLTLFFKNYADPAVLTAIIATTSGTIGALGGILSSPRSAITSTVTSTDATGTVTTKTQPVMLAPVATSPSPTESGTITAQINQPPNNPIPVVETTK